jgi:hypothetical protein
MTKQTFNKINRLIGVARRNGYFVDHTILSDNTCVISISPAARDLRDGHDEITISYRDDAPLAVDYWPRRTYYPMHKMTRSEKVIGAKRITLKAATDMVSGLVVI